MTIPATKFAGGRQATWTRETIITALQRYEALYGHSTAACFSPSAAKWGDRPELAERYVQGDPETGAAWPSLNAIKSRFDGSFNAARVAAGLPVNRPGPALGKRAAGAHAPDRDTRHVVRTVYRDGGATKAELAKAERRAERLAAKVARLEAQLAKPVKPPKVEKEVVTKTKVVRERVTDTSAVERAKRKAEKANAAVAEMRESVGVAERAVREARDAATRAAAKLERSEATVSELRAERRALRSAVDRAADRAAVASREVEELRGRAPVVVHEESPEAAVVRDAEKRAHAAELRAARAERELMETVALVKGERRRLTQAEVAELRRSGPAGKPLVAAALQKLARAKSAQDKALALGELASAAVTWRELIQ
jgi:hypothetical protein